MHLRCGVSFLVTEIGDLHWYYDCPVLTNGAVLQSPPSKTKRLDRDPGYPDRREEVSTTTAHHRIATHSLIAALSCDERHAKERQRHRAQHRKTELAIAPRTKTRECLHINGYSTISSRLKIGAGSAQSSAGIGDRPAVARADNPKDAFGSLN